MRVYTLHYNKPASRKAGKPKVTIHFMGKCHIVDNVAANKSTWWGHVDLKRQPHWVIKGKCNHVEIEDGVAYIS